MELSKRLQAVAELVSEGFVVADVGTDHGYIPIYLLQTKKNPRAIAMDVNKGPLMRAKNHITSYGLDSVIETRLSDGVKSLKLGECESLVVAGMGGALTVKILEEGKHIFKSLKEFILQPQSELYKVREYLLQNEYCIVKENMVLEDGKFYPMFRVINGPSSAYHPVELQYGKLLLEQKNNVLKAFLEKEKAVKELILSNLENETGAHIEIRKKEIQKELEGMVYALQRYYESY